MTNRLFSSGGLVLLLLVNAPYFGAVQGLRNRRKNQHQSLAARTALSGAGTFDRPVCAYGARDGFKGSVSVYVDQEQNLRYLTFDDDTTGSQTEVKCKGQVPASCAPDTVAAPPPGVNATPVPARDCSTVDCPCDRDNEANLDFSYMTSMMTDISPMCEVRSEFNQAEQGPLRVLLVGLGGGALGSYMLAHCPKDSVHLETVEYDPRVMEIAENFFGFKVMPGVSEVENSDGGAAMAKRASSGEKNTYDAVLVDCFMGGGKVPDSCKNQDFITNVKEILKPSGKLIQQIWSPQYEKVIKDYQKSFGEDSVEGRDIEFGVNHLIVATKKDDDGTSSTSFSSSMSLAAMETPHFSGSVFP